MTISNNNSRFAGSRLVNCRRWLLEAVARFRRRWAGKDGRAVARQGAGLVGSKHVGADSLALTAHARRPFFDKEVIAAVCECPALTYELLVATREQAWQEINDMTRETIETDRIAPSVGPFSAAV